MWNPTFLALVLVLLVPFLEAFPSSDTRPLFKQLDFACQFNDGEECDLLKRLTRRSDMFDSLQAGASFGTAKRMSRSHDRMSGGDDFHAKRRGGLDSLVPGGMFGKAAKRAVSRGGGSTVRSSGSDYEGGFVRNPSARTFLRNLRYLNTMDLGGSFGKKAVKRGYGGSSLDVLGNNGFGVEKRADDELDSLKALHLGRSGTSATEEMKGPEILDVYQLPAVEHRTSQLFAPSSDIIQAETDRQQSLNTVVD